MQNYTSYSMTATVLGCLMAVNAAASTQTAVALGSNSTFVALANTTVTVTGGGTITRNIGISPGTTFVAGVPAVTVNGTVYFGGTVAAQAQADLATAYNDAAGRQTPVIVAGNIGGQTLTPGLYSSTSSLAISSGVLTLDAQAVTNQPATGAAAPSSPLAFTGSLPTVSIGGVQSLVTYSGLAPTLVGLYQVNVLVPSLVVRGRAVPVILSIGGALSNAVTIAVQ